MIGLMPAGEARAVVIALDTCVGKCTEEDLRLARAFRQVLASTTQVTAIPSEVMQALSDGMPRSALLPPSLTARELADRLRLGIDHWVSGRYADAENQLADALISVRVNPELVTSDPILRQLIPRAHVARAVSLWRLGHRTIAQEVIAELVRTLPEQSILDTWGTEADKIFQLARKELEALGKGSLVVEIADDSTTRRDAAYGLIGTGLAVGIATTVLYLRRSNDAPRSITAAVVPTRSELFVALGGSF
jgi:hypothetical protein